MTLKNALIGFLVIVVACAMTVRAWRSLSDRYSEARADDYLSEDLGGRGGYWALALAIAEDRPFGVGLNNWSYWVSGVYGPRRGIPYTAYAGTEVPPDQSLSTEILDAGDTRAQAPPAHTVIGLTLGELGWVGLLLFLAIWGQWLRMAGMLLLRRAPNLGSRFGVGMLFALTGLYLHTLTEWAYRFTPTFLLAHLLAGTLAAVYYHQYQRLRAK